jgi:hypothetical protein
LWIGCTHGSGFWFKGGAVSTRGVQQGTWTRRMGSSVLAGHLADLWLSCLFPNRCQALAKHSQIRCNAVNRKVPMPEEPLINTNGHEDVLCRSALPQPHPKRLKCPFVLHFSAGGMRGQIRTSDFGFLSAFGLRVSGLDHP